MAKIVHIENNNTYQQLEDLLNMGWVHFVYNKVDGTRREAYGTRNLNSEGIGFDAIPYGGRVVPEHVLTYYDRDKDGWRCFVKRNWIDYSSDVEVDD